MRQKTVIFDFDGTLADTFSLVVDVSYEIAGATSRLSGHDVEALRRLPLLRAVRALGISWWQVPKLSLHTRRRMFGRIHTVPVFPGVVETLQRLDKDGYRLCVLTSNHKRNAHKFLQTHNLDTYFSDIVGVPYGNVFFKVYGLHKLLKRNQLRAEDCYYIGNEPLDMRAAEISGLKAVATSWGGHERVELAATRPFAIIDKPQDLLEVVRR